MLVLTPTIERTWHIRTLYHIQATITMHLIVQIRLNTNGFMAEYGSEAFTIVMQP